MVLTAVWKSLETIKMMEFGSILPLKVTVLLVRTLPSFGSKAWSWGGGALWDFSERTVLVAGGFGWSCQRP